MNKWCGVIGYIDNVETEPGNYEPQKTERQYFGDIIKNNRLIQNPGEMNDNINVGNQISVVADPYAFNHIYSMRYAEFQGSYWKVTNVDVQSPRLILTLGGLWNG